MSSAQKIAFEKIRLHLKIEKTLSLPYFRCLNYSESFKQLGINLTARCYQVNKGTYIDTVLYFTGSRSLVYRRYRYRTYIKVFWQKGFVNPVIEVLHELNTTYLTNVVSQAGLLFCKVNELCQLYILLIIQRRYLQ